MPPIHNFATEVLSGIDPMTFHAGNKKAKPPQYCALLCTKHLGLVTRITYQDWCRKIRLSNLDYNGTVHRL